MDHEGSIAWNADGTREERKANGHSTFLYYGASRDYDDIDPDPDAAFSSFLIGSSGFRNFHLQLAYRGFTPQQVKTKAGICDLGEDIMGEDWTTQFNGDESVNYYNSNISLNIEACT